MQKGQRFHILAYLRIEFAYYKIRISNIAEERGGMAEKTGIMTNYGIDKRMEMCYFYYKNLL